MGAQVSITPADSIAISSGAAPEAAFIAPNRPCANVLGVAVEALDMEQAICRIDERLRSGQKGYVCAIGVHGVMEAQRNAALAETFAGAAITVPDGMPMVWAGRLQGHRQMRRVAGPDVMIELFRRQEFLTCRHFLYGGKEGVAEQLAAVLRVRFPSARIVGTYTPPYRDLTLQEEHDLVNVIQECSPDIIWVGISAPRQELFMRRFLPKVNVRLMFGVGAAFDFHTGRIQDSPVWVKRAGLQWLHRFLQEPRRLFWRYFRNNPAFVMKIILQLTGVRTYRSSPAVAEPALDSVDEKR